MFDCFSNTKFNIMEYKLKIFKINKDKDTEKKK